jgi:hypothetical protein
MCAGERKWGGAWGFASVASAFDSRTDASKLTIGHPNMPDRILKAMFEPPYVPLPLALGATIAFTISFSSAVIHSLQCPSETNSCANAGGPQCIQLYLCHMQPIRSLYLPTYTYIQHLPSLASPAPSRAASTARRSSLAGPAAHSPAGHCR